MLIEYVPNDSENTEEVLVPRSGLRVSQIRTNDPLDVLQVFCLGAAEGAGKDRPWHNTAEGHLTPHLDSRWAGSSAPPAPSLWRLEPPPWGAQTPGGGSGAGELVHSSPVALLLALCWPELSAGWPREAGWGGGSQPTVCPGEQTLCDAITFNPAHSALGCSSAGRRNNMTLTAVKGQLAGVLFQWTRASVKLQWHFESAGDAEKAAGTVLL